VVAYSSNIEITPSGICNAACRMCSYLLGDPTVSFAVDGIATNKGKHIVSARTTEHVSGSLFQATGQYSSVVSLVCELASISDCPVSALQTFGFSNA